MFRQLLDRVAAVEEDALVAVDERDPAAAGRGVHERRVVGHHAELVGRHLDLPQIRRADRAVLNRQLVLPARAVVGDRQRVGHVVTSSLILVVVRLGATGVSAGSSGHPVVLREPAPEVRHLAALAAERPPSSVDGLPPAVHAERLGACQTSILNRKGLYASTARLQRMRTTSPSPDGSSGLELPTPTKLQAIPGLPDALGVGSRGVRTGFAACAVARARARGDGRRGPRP